MKIVISGWYGAGNLGDEAILEAMIDSISARIPDCEFHVFSKNPELTASSYSVESSPSRLTALVKSAFTMKDADALILGGGGFLHKYSFSAYWMSRPMLAQIMNIPFVFYALGVDTSILDKRVARLLIGGTANRAQLITVRDSISKDVMLKAGVRRLVHVTADPAFDLGMPNEAELRNVLVSLGLDSSDYVVICPGMPGYAGRVLKSEAYESALAGIVDLSTKELGLKVLLIPFLAAEDLGPCKRLMERAEGNGDVAILERQCRPKTVLGLISKSEFAICSRYHSNVFAIATKTPFVSLIYNPSKHLPLLDRAGMSKFGLPIAGLDAVALREAVERLLGQKGNVKRRLAGSAALMDKEASRNVELLLSVLD